MSPPPAQVVGKDAAPSGGTYRVRKGDSLSTIARRLGVPMPDLVAANRLTNVHRLSIGQTLMVPGEGQRFAPYVPELYTVQRGDSVWEVAARFNLDRGEIVALNQLHDNQRIYIGQQLRLLPDAAGAGASTGE